MDILITALVSIVFAVSSYMAVHFWMKPIHSYIAIKRRIITDLIQFSDTRYGDRYGIMREDIFESNRRRDNNRSCACDLEAI